MTLYEQLDLNCDSTHFNKHIVKQIRKLHLSSLGSQLMKTFFFRSDIMICFTFHQVEISFNCIAAAAIQLQVWSELRHQEFLNLK